MHVNPSIASLDSFSDPVWNSLHSTHAHLALSHGLACKYPADVAPFSALAENNPEALNDLRTLLQPGEVTYIVAPAPPPAPGLLIDSGPLCLQMDFPTNVILPAISEDVSIESLTCADAPAMLALIEIAYPGYFRPRTCLMGNYYGIRDPYDRGRLLAMAGERMCPFPMREISGVCTHPDHRGRGYAAALIAQVVQDQRDIQAMPTLWVVARNVKAIDVYARLGFVRVRETQLYRITCI